MGHVMHCVQFDYCFLRSASRWAYRVGQGMVLMRVMILWMK